MHRAVRAPEALCTSHSRASSTARQQAARRLSRAAAKSGDRKPVGVIQAPGGGLRQPRACASARGTLARDDKPGDGLRQLDSPLTSTPLFPPRSTCLLLFRLARLPRWSRGAENLRRSHDARPAAYRTSDARRGGPTLQVAQLPTCSGPHSSHHIRLQQSAALHGVGMSLFGGLVCKVCWLVGRGAVRARARGVHGTWMHGRGGEPAVRPQGTQLV